MSIYPLTEKILHDYAVANLNKAETYPKYKSAVDSLCEFCKKEFPAIDSHDAKRYFDYCERVKLNDENTLVFKRSVFLSLAAFLEDRYKDYSILPFTYSDAYRFLHFENSQYISPDMLPKIKDVDRLISYLKDKRDYRTLFTVSLALKLSLTASEIINIRASDFIENDAGEKFIRIRNSKPPDRFLLMPADLTAVADLYFKSLSAKIQADGNAPIITSKGGKPLTYRTVANDLKEACKETGVDITFNNLRNLSIAYMLKQGAEDDDIAALTGTVGGFYRRFNPAVQAIVRTSVDYNCIYLRF